MQNYGPEDQFAYMQGECYEIKIEKYTYRVCPFSKAAQVDAGRDTSLGAFQELRISSDGAEMQFANVRSFAPATATRLARTRRDPGVAGSRVLSHSPPLAVSCAHLV